MGKAVFGRRARRRRKQCRRRQRLDHRGPFAGKSLSFPGRPLAVARPQHLHAAACGARIACAPRANCVSRSRCAALIPSVWCACKETVCKPRAYHLEFVYVHHAFDVECINSITWRARVASSAEQSTTTHSRPETNGFALRDPCPTDVRHRDRVGATCSVEDRRSSHRHSNKAVMTCILRMTSETRSLHSRARKGQQVNVRLTAQDDWDCICLPAPARRIHAYERCDPLVHVIQPFDRDARHCRNVLSLHRSAIP
jgi:hypothetical protein